MADTTPQAVQAAHELLLWIIPQIDKFPRVRRFTLGERLESTLLEVLEATLEAAFSARKQAALDRANLRLETARHLWRLALELRAAPAVQSWIGHAAHADTWGLRERIFSEIVFSWGAGRTAAGG